MAAEILTDPTIPVRPHDGFNEAAANGRGNRRPWPAPESRAPCFNEAAANGRGNHTLVKQSVYQAPIASMRPRRMAAEIPSTSPAR